MTHPFVFCVHCPKTMGIINKTITLIEFTEINFEFKNEYFLLEKSFGLCWPRFAKYLMKCRRIGASLYS